MKRLRSTNLFLAVLSLVVASLVLAPSTASAFEPLKYGPYPGDSHEPEPPGDDTESGDAEEIIIPNGNHRPDVKEPIPVESAATSPTLSDVMSGVASWFTNWIRSL